MGTEKKSCKTAAVMNLLNRGPAGERVLPAQPQGRDIEAITGEILEAKRTGGEAILTIGRGLMEAKALLPHGEWLPWLEGRVEFSEKAAQNFMRIARHYANPQALADLGATKALMLLAIPDEARDEFISAPHQVNGEEKTVAGMTTRELEAAIKERDEARMAAEQARAEQSAAELSRQKMEQDMRVATQRVEALNGLVERQSAEARERQEELSRLSGQLKQLRERPVEVAVEADRAAVEAARKEAEAAMQARVDEAQAARDHAQSSLMELNGELQRARMAQEDALRERDALRAQLERAEKKAALTSDANLALFSELFDQIQEIGNKMTGVLMKVRGKDPETAQGLGRAVLAWTDKMKGAAQG